MSSGVDQLFTFSENSKSGGKAFSDRLTAHGGTLILGDRGGLAPQFTSEILVGAPNFASKNISDKYPKFFPLNSRCDPKIGIFPPNFASCGNRTSQFFLLFGELGWTLPQILPPNLM